MEVKMLAPTGVEAGPCPSPLLHSGESPGPAPLHKGRAGRLLSAPPGLSHWHSTRSPEPLLSSPGRQCLFLSEGQL